MAHEKDAYEITINSWNKVAELYQEKFMDFDMYNSSYDYFLSQLSNHAKILDVGCGPGNISSYLSSQNQELEISGIDVSNAMVSLAKKNVPGGKFQVLDVRDITNIQEKYDGIICGFCVPYLSKDDVSKLVSDWHNLLTEKGVLYISFVEGDYNNSGYITGSSGDEMYFYYHEFGVIESVLKKMQFSVIKHFEVSYPRGESDQLHNALIVRK